MSKTLETAASNEMAESSSHPLPLEELSLEDAFDAHVALIRERGDSTDALHLKSGLGRAALFGAVAGVSIAPGLDGLSSVVGCGLTAATTLIASHIKTRRCRIEGQRRFSEQTQAQVGQAYELYYSKDQDQSRTMTLRYYGPYKEDATVRDVSDGLKTIASLAAMHGIDKIAVGTDVLEAINSKRKPTTTMATLFEHLKGIEAGGSAKYDTMLVDTPEEILRLAGGYGVEDLVRILSEVSPEHPIAKVIRQYKNAPQTSLYQHLQRAAETTLEMSGIEAEPESMLRNPSVKPTRVRITEMIDGEIAEKSGTFVAPKSRGLITHRVRDGRVHIFKDDRLSEPNVPLERAYPHLSRDPSYILNTLRAPHVNPDETAGVVAYELVRVLTRPNAAPLGENDVKTGDSHQDSESSAENIVESNQRARHQGAYIDSDEWSLGLSMRLRFPERARRLGRFAFAGLIAGSAVFAGSSFADNTQKAHQVAATERLGRELKIDQHDIPPETARALAAKGSKKIHAWESLQDGKGWINHTLEYPFGGGTSGNTTKLVPDNIQQIVGNDAGNPNKADWHLQPSGIDPTGYWRVAVSHSLRFQSADMPAKGILRQVTGHGASMSWDTTPNPNTLQYAKLPLHPAVSTDPWIKVSRIVGGGDDSIKIPVLEGTEPIAANISGNTSLQLVTTEDGAYAVKRIHGQKTGGGSLNYWIKKERLPHPVAITPTHITAPVYDQRAIDTALNIAMDGLPKEPRARARAIEQHISNTWEYKRNPVPEGGMKNIVDLSQYVKMEADVNRADCSTAGTLEVLGDPKNVYAQFGYHNSGSQNGTLSLGSHEVHQWARSNLEPTKILDATPTNISPREAAYFKEAPDSVRPKPKQPSKLPLYAAAGGLIVASGVRYRRQLATSVQSVAKGPELARRLAGSAIETQLHGRKGELALRLVQQALYDKEPNIAKALKKAAKPSGLSTDAWTNRSRPDLRSQTAKEVLATLKNSPTGQDAAVIIRDASRTIRLAQIAVALKDKPARSDT